MIAMRARLSLCKSFGSSVPCSSSLPGQLTDFLKCGCGAAAGFHADVSNSRSYSFRAGNPTIGQSSTKLDPSSAKLPSLQRAVQLQARDDLDFQDLRGLMEKLTEVLPTDAVRGAPIDEDLKDQITAMLQRVRLNPREWQQHAVYRKGRYTRSIVGFSPGQFIALLLCWERGQQSAIHDHTGAHCFVKMLSGQLRETLYDWPDGDGKELKELHDAGVTAARPSESVCFMHDSKGVHRVYNPSAEEIAVSLHIYTPPFAQCQVFAPTGAKPTVAAMASPHVIDNSKLRVGEAPTLQSFCEALPGLRRWRGAKPDVASVTGLLESVELDAGEWGMHCSASHFSEFHPVQHVVHHCDDFSVVVACFNPGQTVRPHVVGRGRQFWMRVVHGNMRYERLASSAASSNSRVEIETILSEGSVSTLGDDHSKLHRFANASSTEPAVCISVFSPPLTQFCYQTPLGIERKDVPVLLPFPRTDQRPRVACTQTATPSGGTCNGVNGFDAGFVGKERSALNGPSVCVSPYGVARTAGRRFVCFHSFATMLEEVFETADFSSERIGALLERSVFDPEEWRLCVDSLSEHAAIKTHEFQPVEFLIGKHSKYNLILTVWEADQWTEHSPILGDSSSGASWTFVLQGELQESVHDGAGNLLRRAVLKEECVSFIDGSGVVRRTCMSETKCVAMHIEESQFKKQAVFAPSEMSPLSVFFL